MKNPIRHSLKAWMMIILALCWFSAALAETDGTVPFYRAGDLFTARDLKQTADTAAAETLTVSDRTDLRITRPGIYVLSGTAADATVYVEVEKEDKVQLVLNGLSVTNADFPCIYVLSADKVFITTAAGSSLSVTGAFRKEDDRNVDGVIFSKEDLVLNGTAQLTIDSSGSGIICKDDLKVTGGTYVIRAAAKAVEANDSIRVCGGDFTLTAGTDALHAENKKDEVKGYVMISGGTFTIEAGDDGIYARSVLQIDGGEMNISAREGLEATVVQINGGTIRIDAVDHSIHTAEKSSAYTPAVYRNGGDVQAVEGENEGE